MQLLSVDDRLIGPGQPVWIAAEISGNHLGDRRNALELVRAAAAAGADAVKFQTYTADTITIRCDRPEFRIGAGTVWDGRQLHDLYLEASTPWEWHAELVAEAKRLGLAWFSSPFDPTAVDFLIQLGCPVLKIASFELPDLPLIRRCAATGRPLIISTGMATLAEIDEAVRAARGAGCRQLALLKCTSAYPTPLDEVDLRTIPFLADAFACPAGLSDHTLFDPGDGSPADGASVPVAAVALGATIIEKHLCLDRARGGPDAGFSLTPGEFAALVRAVRGAERALGRVRCDPSPREAASRQLRRSLFVVRAVAAGETVGPDNVRSIRPGHGLHPRHAEEVLGRTFRTALAAGTPLAWDHLAPRTAP